MPATLAEHCDRIVTAIQDNRVVPFFGAGVNLCGRPQGAPWQRGQYLPSGGELSQHLAEKFKYPDDDKWDLLRVSQYIAATDGTGPLYQELRHLFNAAYPPTSLHDLFASIPAYLRVKGAPSNHLLIVTTNYDDLMERAFEAAGESFDVVTYEAEDRLNRGRFWHWPPKGEAKLIDKPNKYRGLSLDERSVILKIHGAIDRANPMRDSFVITEDHYIDYLTRTDISNLIPVTLAQKLSQSHFLFLGYSLRDWNMRAILHRIWGEQRLSFNSWAIQLNPQSLDQKFWDKRNVEIFDVSLEEYIHELKVRL
jgi:SIR2-like domain